MSIGQGSFFQGWSNTQPNTGGRRTSSANQSIILGQVLKVDYDGEDAGRIRVRLLGLSKEFRDDDVKVRAYPADLNQIKYPLPGEIVLVVQATKNQFANNKPIRDYYYTTVLTSRGSITYNSDPYIGNSLPSSEAEYILSPEYEHRFENKIGSLDSFIKKTETGYEVKDHPALKPSEGDFVIQGRFGSSIRMGSTSLNSETEWSDKGGIAGDPILILSSDRVIKENPISEEVDSNDSAFYICSTQTLPVDMATSELKSHLFTQNL